MMGSPSLQRLSVPALLFCGLLAAPLLAQNPMPANPQTPPATAPTDQSTPATTPDAPTPPAQEAPPPSNQTLAQQAGQADELLQVIRELEQRLVVVLPLSGHNQEKVSAKTGCTAVNR